MMHPLVNGTSQGRPLCNSPRSSPAPGAEPVRPAGARNAFAQDRAPHCVTLISLRRVRGAVGALLLRDRLTTEPEAGL